MGSRGQTGGFTEIQARGRRPQSSGTQSAVPPPTGQPAPQPASQPVAPQSMNEPIGGVNWAQGVFGQGRQGFAQQGDYGNIQLKDFITAIMGRF